MNAPCSRFLLILLILCVMYMRVYVYASYWSPCVCGDWRSILDVILYHPLLEHGPAPLGQIGHDPPPLLTPSRELRSSLFGDSSQLTMPGSSMVFIRYAFMT